jgi:hypothetical protein
MPIQCKCPECGYRYKIADDLAGKTVLCPECRTRFKPKGIPPAVQTTMDDESGPAQTAGKRTYGVAALALAAVVGAVVVGTMVGGTFLLIGLLSKDGTQPAKQNSLSSAERVETPPPRQGGSPVAPEAPTPRQGRSPVAPEAPAVAELDLLWTIDRREELGRQLAELGQGQNALAPGLEQFRERMKAEQKSWLGRPCRGRMYVSTVGSDGRIMAELVGFNASIFEIRPKSRRDPLLATLRAGDTIVFHSTYENPRDGRWLFVDATIERAGKHEAARFLKLEEVSANDQAMQAEYQEMIRTENQTLQHQTIRRHFERYWKWQHQLCEGTVWLHRPGGLGLTCFLTSDNQAPFIDVGGLRPKPGQGIHLVGVTLRQEDDPVLPTLRIGARLSVRGMIHLNISSRALPYNSWVVLDAEITKVE